MLSFVKLCEIGSRATYFAYLKNEIFLHFVKTFFHVFFWSKICQRPTYFCYLKVVWKHEFVKFWEFWSKVPQKLRKSNTIFAWKNALKKCEFEKVKSTKSPKESLKIRKSWKSAKRKFLKNTKFWKNAFFVKSIKLVNEPFWKPFCSICVQKVSKFRHVCLGEESILVRLKLNCRGWL